MIHPTKTSSIDNLVMKTGLMVDLVN